MDQTIIIDKDFVEIEAENILGRKLTDKEYEDIYEKINEDAFMLIQSSINEVIDFNEMIERNRGAEKEFPQYKVYWKNENAYQSDFKQMGTFKTEKDAKMLVHKDFIGEFDYWKIVSINKDGTEEEVYKVHWPINPN